MDADEIYTGPPVGEPPDHVHEETPSIDPDSIDVLDDEVDDLVREVRNLDTKNTEGFARISERLETCLNRLESLQNPQQTENPLLLQIQQQLTQTQTELENLKSLLATKLTIPERRSLPLEEPTPEMSSSLRTDESTVEVSEVVVENPPEMTPPKRRWT